jgi:Lysylphosphatidylglycerol synthase TM region
MVGLRTRRWRHVLPWLISFALLAYLFGWATDWQRLREAARAAHLPLFVACTTADRLAFFLVWTLLQAAALRRFVTRVPVRSIVAVRGGSELLRTVSNPLSDAAFFLGLGQLTGGRLDAVLAAALVPTVCHLLVLLCQMTLALPFLEGGIGGNRDVLVTAVVTWIAVGVAAVAVRLSARRAVPIRGTVRLRAWLERFPLRELRPFFLGFVGLTIFDILIQGLGSRAFGVEIPWTALAARIPLLYLALVIPTLGNFGTREVAWAALFDDFGDRSTLIAYALAVNGIFLVINLVLGLAFLARALELLAAVRRAQREGAAVPEPILHDPTDL